MVRGSWEPLQEAKASANWMPSSVSASSRTLTDGLQLAGYALSSSSFLPYLGVIHSYMLNKQVFAQRRHSILAHQERICISLQRPVDVLQLHLRADSMKRPNGRLQTAQARLESQDKQPCETVCSMRTSHIQANGAVVLVFNGDGTFDAANGTWVSCTTTMTRTTGDTKIRTCPRSCIRARSPLPWSRSSVTESE